MLFSIINDGWLLYVLHKYVFDMVDIVYLYSNVAITRLGSFFKAIHSAQLCGISSENHSRMAPLASYL